MGSSTVPNSREWFLDNEMIQDDYIWAQQMMSHDPSPIIFGFDESRDWPECACPNKRSRTESCTAPGTKACREKMRRDKLNDRFTELCSILDPERPPKADKVAILSDATRLLNQLRLEVHKLKESNEALQDTNKNLKAEKTELRDEKLRLKAEKERIEQMLKGMSIAPPFITHPSAVVALHAAAFAAYSKTMPYTNYPPTGLWQWVPQTALDTSQDHVFRPPVA